MSKRRKRRDRKRKSGLFKKVILVGSLTFLLLIVFLPIIVSKTPIKDRLIAWATADLNGSVRIERLNVAWWSYVSASGISVKDPDGQPVVNVESLSLEQTLFNLILNRKPGKIVLDGIDFEIALRPDGSNIEDLIKNYIETPKDEQSDSTPASLEITWTAATGRITAQGSPQTWQLSDSNGSVLFGLGESSLEILVDGSLQTNNLPANSFRLAAQIGNDPRHLSFSDGQIRLESPLIECSIATPICERLHFPLSVQGRFNGKAECTWLDYGSQFTIATDNVQLDQLILRSNDYLGPDTLTVETGQLNGKVGLEPAGWRAENLQATTNFGQLVANGTVNFSELMMALSKGRLPNTELQANGAVDFAQLSRMLPSTLRLQENVVLESALVRIEANNRVDSHVKQADLNIAAPRLQATQNGQRISWNQPINVVANIVEQNNDLIIQQLKCDSDLILIEGQGNLAKASFRVKSDLRQMIEQLSQLFDLGGIQVSGLLDGKLAWDRTTVQSELEPFQIAADLQIARPVVQTNNSVWQQPELQIRMDATAQVDSENNLLVSAAKSVVNAGQDQLEITLLEGLVNPGLSSRIPAQLFIQGNLQSWLAQLSPFLPLPELDANGHVSASARAEIELPKVIINGLKSEFTQLAANTLGLRIREQKVMLDGNFEFNVDTGGFLADQVVLISSTVAASGNSIRYQPETSGGLEGAVAFRANLNQITRLLPQLDDHEVKWFGELTGQTNLHYDGNSIAGSVNATIKDLVAAVDLNAASTSSNQRSNQLPPSNGINAQTGSQASNQNGWRVLWSEPQVQIESNLVVSSDLDRLQLNSLALDSKAIRLSANGNVANLLSTLNINLQGVWAADFENVNELIAAYTYDAIRLNGSEARNFTIQGPLFSDPEQLEKQGNAWLPYALRAQTEVAWQNLSVYGLDVGPAVAATGLANSAVSINTKPISVSGGSVQLNPVVHLRGQAPTIVVPEGQIVNGVQLTVENSREWLKFVAPLAAEATSTQGAFSVSTTGVRLPLANFNAAQGDVLLTIHDARIGPGPLGTQLISLANQIKTLIEGANASHIADANAQWLVIPQQDVPVTIQAGRVIHRGMTFRSGDTVIQTSGSVGLDQTLDLVVEVPISDRWLGNRPLLAGLKGQKLAIPLTGTVSKPRLDTNGLQQFAGQLLRQSAETAIQNKVEDLISREGQKLQDKLLEGIFPPNSNSPAQGETPPTSTREIMDGVINEGLNRILRPKRN
ncbi:MAG TPA: hypothetical protein PKD64_14625 [Pirellulaceae bacterium]|nr:hypothetical protein [Pirellulaceae bacterium]HMO93417.1 hypothetical protein [Pirellulaceae bacterium]HMP70459.1 hypothetical protein [Pirellulaceae bacterium]